MLYYSLIETNEGKVMSKDYIELAIIVGSAVLMIGAFLSLCAFYSGVELDKKIAFCREVPAACKLEL